MFLLPFGGLLLECWKTVLLFFKKTYSPFQLNFSFFVVVLTSLQLSCSHEECVELVRVALEQEGLGGILIEDGNRVVHLDVEGHQDPLEFLLVLLLHHNLALVVHDPVGARGVGHPPLNPDGGAVHLGLVSQFPDVGEPHLYNGAGLASPDEGLVGVASAGDPGVAAECEYDSGEDCRLAGPILPGEECQTLVRVEGESLITENNNLVLS